MVGGGAGSGSYPLPRLAYSRDELKAFAEEAEKSQTYATGHIYSDEGVARTVECGFRCIEHATLIQPATAKMLKEKDVIVCPTIVTNEAQIAEAKALGLAPDFIDRIKFVVKKSPESLEIMHKAGVKMVFGTDLLGLTHKYQADEFVIRGRTLPAIEVIRAATCNAADLLRLSGKVGTVKAGAYADLIVLDTDPLKDLSVFGHEGRHMPAVMKDGEFVKNHLNA
jgi:imidazolonepropionase-like amidohydrolase